MSDLHQIFTHVTYGSGLVLLWQRSDTLHTSGFVGDVILAHKPRVLNVTAQLSLSSYTALGLAVNGTQEYSLQAMDARDYFLQSYFIRPQWAC